MNTGIVERLTWGGAAALTIVAVLGWGGAVPSPKGEPAVLPSAPESRHPISPDSLAADAEAIVERNLFRADRRPTQVAYSPGLESAPHPPPPPRSHPQLMLRGIIGGPPWGAVLEGVPGHAGSVVVRPGDLLGDSISPLKVRAIGRDVVVIRGADTTWRLTVARTW